LQLLLQQSRSQIVRLGLENSALGQKASTYQNSQVCFEESKAASGVPKVMEMIRVSAFEEAIEP